MPLGIWDKGRVGGEGWVGQMRLRLICMLLLRIRLWLVMGHLGIVGQGDRVGRVVYGGLCHGHWVG